jgi:hypothetical protein
MAAPPAAVGSAASQVADAEESTVVATLLTALAVLSSVLLGRHLTRRRARAHACARAAGVHCARRGCCAALRYVGTRRFIDGGTWRP